MSPTVVSGGPQKGKGTSAEALAEKGIYSGKQAVEQGTHSGDGVGALKGSCSFGVLGSYF